MSQRSLGRFQLTPAHHDLPGAANSFAWNILPASPCESRFYGNHIRPSFRKSLRINLFRAINVRNGSKFEAKSLFWNILPPSPCGSRFYGDTGRYPSRKFLRMKILESTRKKIVRSLTPTDRSSAVSASILALLLSLSRQWPHE